jgi:hypothetical protein
MTTWPRHDEVGYRHERGLLFSFQAAGPLPTAWLLASILPDREELGRVPLSPRAARGLLFPPARLTSMEFSFGELMGVSTLIELYVISLIFEYL